MICYSVRPGKRTVRAGARRLQGVGRGAVAAGDPAGEVPARLR